ncbi:putative Tetratricopeptide repeat protein 30B [Blattamonas nauphoetae]|uniref:Tetratricopeptide repeat protein 30B n=1 Tax=Blattamonas nauphoetae TaxID=2049346 RepID=A0ABQ9YM13_9EUKA|nr:putative Tetratricopeptide repeat protein 30B [Blattamonas nauphoetae]
MTTGLPGGSLTQSVYSLIQDGKYKDAIVTLARLKSQLPNNRASNSLLAYCYFNDEQFDEAAQVYEFLTIQFPTVRHYRLSWIQSLYKAGRLDEAERQCFAGKIHPNEEDDPIYTHNLNLVHAQIKYDKDELQSANRFLIDNCDENEQDVKVIEGAILFKEKKFEMACQKFVEAIPAGGYMPHIAYNIALSHFQLKRYGLALKSIEDIQEKANRDQQENMGTSKDSMLIEALNLKAAIDYNLKEYDKAQDAMLEMPEREEHDLDSVTLHNTAVMSVEQDPDDAIEKLYFLLASPPFPKETVTNLLLLLCKTMRYDEAGEVLKAERIGQGQLTSGGGQQRNSTQGRIATGKMNRLQTAVNSVIQGGGFQGATVDPQLREFVEASIIQNTSPEEAYRLFQKLAAKQFDELKKSIKAMQDLRTATLPPDTVTLIMKQHQDCIHRYMPTQMAMARIFWDLKKYPQTAQVLQGCRDVCGEELVWQINLAHTLFVQTRYEFAKELYEKIMEKQQVNSILDVTPIVLGNLCVCHVMHEENDLGEQIIVRVDKEEEKIHMEDPDAQPLHHTIIDLVIGTLYCSRKTFDFGIKQTIKSFQPVEQKLTPGTWFYAKRNFCYLQECLAKHSGSVTDATQSMILEFLDKVDEFGKEIPAENGVTDAVDVLDSNYADVVKKKSAAEERKQAKEKEKEKKNRDPKKDPKLATVSKVTIPQTVSDEARLIKCMFLRIFDEE